LTRADDCPGGNVVTIGAGQVTTGGVLSTTVTLNWHEAPAAAVQVTTDLPTGKNDPEPGEQVTAPQDPLGIGSWNVTTAPHWFGSFNRVASPGQVSLQATSVTVTLNMQLAVLPEPSVAVQVTGVVPTGKFEPEGGLQFVVTPGQLSLAVGGG